MPDGLTQLVKQQADIIRTVSVLLFLIGVATASIAQTAVAWPEADKLLHSDPRWLGADGAFSIDLGNNRVLWMFNDTFVALHPGDDRRHAAFLHNTVAVQTGYDPSHATIKFYWRTIHGGSSEIFPSEGSDMDVAWLRHPDRK